MAGHVAHDDTYSRARGSNSASRSRETSSTLQNAHTNKSSRQIKLKTMSPNPPNSYTMIGYSQEIQHHHEHLCFQEDRQVPGDRIRSKLRSCYLIHLSSSIYPTGKNSLSLFNCVITPEVQQIQQVRRVQEHQRLPWVQCHHSLPWHQADHQHPESGGQERTQVNTSLLESALISPERIIEGLTGGPANPAGPGGPVSPRSPCWRNNEVEPVRGCSPCCRMVQTL